MAFIFTTSLAMGLTDATDIFETVICDLLKDLNGVLNIADDILVFGNTYDSFKKNVISFLDHCVAEDIHLNPDKIQIDCEKVPFFGHTSIQRMVFIQTKPKLN